jgi:hypothetical protein
MLVRFQIPGTPGSCDRYYTKRLTIQKKIFGQAVWFSRTRCSDREPGNSVDGKE